MEIQIPIDVRLAESPSQRGYKVFLTSDVGLNYRDHLAGQVNFEPVDITAEHPAAFILGYREAEKLMNDLWRLGVRPADGNRYSETLAAVQAHLADARHVAETAREHLRLLTTALVISQGPDGSTTKISLMGKPQTFEEQSIKEGLPSHYYPTGG